MFILLLIVVGCSRSLEKDYKVVDASHQEIPEWVFDLEEYLDDEVEEDELKKSRFYLYSTVAKNDRDIACKIANANASSAIASEISTFIEEKFKQELDGDSSNSNKKLTEFVVNDLKRVVSANIVGAQKYREYWEKRRFMKDKGAAKDWDGFVCTVLFKIPKSQLEKAFKRTEQKLKEQSITSSHAKVEKVMAKLLDEYTRDQKESKTK